MTLERVTSSHPAGHWPRPQTSDRVTLDYDGRHRRRLRILTDSGRAFLLDLPKAVALAQGDGLRTESGAWIEVRAAAEPLLEIGCIDPRQLVRLAWHVGNRHVPAEIRPPTLRIRPDAVIADMLRGLGGLVREIVAPFQPESGAYARRAPHAHAHDHEHDHGSHAH